MRGAIPAWPNGKPSIREFKAGFLILSAGFDFMETDPAPQADGAFRVEVSGVRRHRSGSARAPCILSTYLQPNYSI